MLKRSATGRRLKFLIVAMACPRGWGAAAHHQKHVLWPPNQQETEGTAGEVGKHIGEPKLIRHRIDVGVIPPEATVPLQKFAT